MSTRWKEAKVGLNQGSWEAGVISDTFRICRWVSKDLKRDGRRGFILILSCLGGPRHAMVSLSKRSNMRKYICIYVYTQNIHIYIYR